MRNSKVQVIPIASGVVLPAVGAREFHLLPLAGLVNLAPAIIIIIWDISHVPTIV